MRTKKAEAIRLRGVKQNNLKDFDIDIPLGKLTVVTGLSGSGKSSLVFDTLHAEGQRRYVETFSPYTRQFMDMMDRPNVDLVENIRPSIAIEQSNTVKTSRSTVGTMTELCDFFKVWFSHRAELFDPVSGAKVEDDNPQTVWKKLLASFQGQSLVLAFKVRRLGKLSWSDVLSSLSSQAYTRFILENKFIRLDDLDPESLAEDVDLFVVQDRLKVEELSETRFIESATTAFHFGQQELFVFDFKAKLLVHYSEGLHSTDTNTRFKQSSPALFSFNSPVGACPKCRGFGRSIEIDYRLVIPDESLSIKDGAIKAFQGDVYKECLRELLQACSRLKISVDVAWSELPEKHRQLIIDGEPSFLSGQTDWSNSWYGIKGFFDWLVERSYKMHIRVFLSRFRSYVLCSDCNGSRLKPDALFWKWKNYSLPGLYKLSIEDLLVLVDSESEDSSGDHESDLAGQAIRTRLSYLNEVGLSYLTLDRSSRSLSGGEVERVNLTSCLGTGLTDTLFVLDEPSVGLHSRDIHRLIRILRQLSDQGNTVVVVEHDEAIMRAADHIIEVGPRPGVKGGYIVAEGSIETIESHEDSITGAYLSGRKEIEIDARKRSISEKLPYLKIKGASKHNINQIDLSVPLDRFVVFTGVSGSGKSTLLNNVIYQALLSQHGKAVDDPASFDSLGLDIPFSEVVLANQSPVSKTPRSNVALFTGVWELIRNLFAKLNDSKAWAYTASTFSFNSGAGRCSHCEGLGVEKVEMQFMADVYVECPVCEGKRFQPEVLEILYEGKNVHDVLQLTVSEALVFFKDSAKIAGPLQALSEVGLDYLALGQSLSTLSGGEAQRLKLVKYLGQVSSKWQKSNSWGSVARESLSTDDSETNKCLLLLDEPTTGLHKDDVKRLLAVLQKLVNAGHSVFVIEHHLDVIASADWVIEVGPDAGDKGGKIVFEGTPTSLKGAHTETATFLSRGNSRNEMLVAAEESLPFESSVDRFSTLSLRGAREHNLKDVSIDIPYNKITVITGVSGSGKSSLAFDIVFAEGQRRFMESMSAWARQFVEQLPRPNIDVLKGIPPTVAIEQRVTRGSRKSTVATITEIAQYLRLLFARVGVQYSTVSNEPLIALDHDALLHRLKVLLPKASRLYAPMLRGRKGHHEPLAKWAKKQGYEMLRIDGAYVPIDQFKKLDRYKEHDIDVEIADLALKKPAFIHESLRTALRLGHGACFLVNEQGDIVSWFSTKRTDPQTGDAYPELDPKHFSWNSSRGCCPCCRGYGMLFDWMKKSEEYDALPSQFHDEDTCPVCSGERLNEVARHVYLQLLDGSKINLPELLNQTSEELLNSLSRLDLDRRGKAILKDLLPEVSERLKFMGEVGLAYLSLSRSTQTLSGGEAQRIRLAAQLGSNLSGVLYVLDEPSIGLHARDNEKLIQSLKDLRKKGNTLLVVEHDEDTMRAADRVIDLGPGAGIHGGEVLAEGTLKQIQRNKKSLTGRYVSKGIAHPLRGEYRTLPKALTSRNRTKNKDWLALDGASLRNLKSVDLRIPHNRLTVVCGVSGAGKSTLIRELLQKSVRQCIDEKTSALEGKKFVGIRSDKVLFKKLTGVEGFRSIIEVDQSPIGKTPRSTPATYIGAFDQIRAFFANLAESKMRGFTASTFSFNTKGGRCEHCKGAGRVKLEMAFMPDVYVECEECNGRRYGSELEDIRWNGKNIADVLAMSVEEAVVFFEFHARLHAVFSLMDATGLGYVKIGQISPTLSGGEAQRLKLVNELSKGLETHVDRMRGTKPKNLYILEEPTIGLHLSDCEKLIELLHKIVDQGHTVVVIEHHTDLISEADYIVEVGPNGGDEGGEILYQGNVEGLSRCEISQTAIYL